MKKFLAAVFVLLVMANAPAFASNFGPATPAVEPGNFYFGVGAQRHNADWEVDVDGVADSKARQNRFYVQGGYVFGNGLEGHLRIGGSDLEYEKLFQPSGNNEDFENEDTAPYASVGIKGMLRKTNILDVGFFLEGGFTGKFEDTVAGANVEFEEAWEANAGLILQKQIEGAYLYGGPVIVFNEGDFSIVNANLSGTFEEEDNLGAFLGIRWPLKNGMNIDLEGQLKSDFSIGGNILFPF